MLSKLQDARIADREGDKVIVWASISPYRPRRERYDEVDQFSIYITKRSRGSGVGKYLLNELIGEAAKLGYCRLLSRIFGFNSASRALCKSCGFRGSVSARNTRSSTTVSGSTRSSLSA